MTADRKALKSACVLELEKRARPHPAGNNKDSLRCFLVTPGGSVAVMFEQNLEARPHLWLPTRVTAGLRLPAGRTKPYPASALWTNRNKKGERLYGRHSNLRQMPELRDADLTRVTLISVHELRDILSDLGC